MLAAAVTLPFLDEVVALIAASVVIVYVCYRLKLEPIVGYLLAGVLIGPNAFGLVTDQQLVDSLAEIGVVLLLFTIGVEFSLEKLSRIGRFIVVGGGLQVGLSIAAVVGIGLMVGMDLSTGIFTGFLVALSSTAIGLKLLSKRNETDTPVGQLTLAILIFQDFAIIAMVLLLPLLSGEGGSALSAVLALGEALLIVAVVLFLARKLIPWLLAKVAATHQSELFLLTVVIICIGTGWITNLAGVSLALGAFLAGLVVSESKYSAQALSDVLPLQSLFNAVFFVSVGMLLDPAFLLQNLPLVLTAAAGVLVLKALLTIGSVLILGYPIRVAAAVGLGLAQIGEFSFVLERTGAAFGLSPMGLGASGAQVFIAVTVLLMILTPFFGAVGRWVGAKLERTPLGDVGEAQPVPDVAARLEDHVVVVGYGPAGQRLAQVLKDVGLPFLVLELNPELADRAVADDMPVLRGDATRLHMLEHAAIKRAKLCAIVINDADAARNIVEAARYLNPTLQIIVRTRFLADMQPLQRAGADIIVPEEMETAVRIFTQVLGAYMIPSDEIDRQVAAIRSGDYKVFRGSIQEAHLMVLQGLDEDGLHTRAVAVRPGAPAAGQTLRDLALRQHHGLTVLAIRRGDRTLGSPAGDFRIEPGDRLVLVGTADQFAASADLFRTRPTPPVTA